MREKSLIHRLRERDPGDERSTQLDVGRLADSVMLNLRQMLNSRQGLARTVQDYGLPDLTDVVHNFPEAIDICKRSIRASIEKYEPRLTSVAVDHVPDPDDIFHLRFEIRGKLKTDREALPVAFYTTLDASGQAQVSR
jgi:type VI secretion system protein